MWLLFAIAAVFSAGVTVRLILLVLGRRKGPLLQKLERYGELEPFYPLWELVYWILLLCSTSVMALTMYPRDSVRWQHLLLLGLILLLVALEYNRPARFVALLQRLPMLPLWYARLLRIASRAERRRVAYMWLHLPLRVRAAYDASDALFFNWADLVVMSAVLEEDHDLDVENVEAVIHRSAL